jgi:catechol 2,3-dioxygenase
MTASRHACAPDLKIGHVHLHVRDVDEAVDFYHSILGFDVMGVAKQFQMGFVSAGGYHHHLGLNTWQGRGAPPPPPDALGLRYYTIDLPNQQRTMRSRLGSGRRGRHHPSNQTEAGSTNIRSSLHDPSQNGVVVLSCEWLGKAG